MRKIIILSTLFTLLFTLSLSAKTRRALLIGISNYDKEHTNWNRIHGTNDVALMQTALKGFKVIKLLDSQATFDNIKGAFKDFTDNSKPGDIVYVHLSGHGQPVEDVSHDESDGWDESFVPYDAMNKYKKGVYEGQQHLTDDILHGYIRSLREKVGKKGIVYVSIDACYSGDMSKGGLNIKEDNDSLIDNSLASVDSLSEESDIDVYKRGSSAGFTMNHKTFSVKNGMVKKFSVLESSSLISPIVMLESCLSNQQSKEKRCVCYKNGKKRDYYCGVLTYSIYKVLTQSNIQLTTDTSWTSKVRPVFDKTKHTDYDQELVIESAK